MAGWFFAWFGPGLDGVALTPSTPSTPSTPVSAEMTLTDTDPDAIDHLEEALDRLCEQFKED